MIGISAKATDVSSNSRNEIRPPPTRDAPMASTSRNRSGFRSSITGPVTPWRGMRQGGNGMMTEMAVSPVRLHRTVGVRVGHVQVGGGAPVVVQSMTMTDTADAKGTAAQCVELAEAGRSEERRVGKSVEP